MIGPSGASGALTAPPPPARHGGRLGAYLSLGRVSNLPTVWTNVLAAMVLAGEPVLPAAFLGLALAFSLFYVAGMWLNDAFDRELDRRLRPERPIPAGAVGAGEVFAGGFALLALALLALGAASAGGTGWTPALWGALLAGTIVYYDAHHKGNPASPVVMGLCRVLVYVTTAFAVAGAAPPAVMAGAGILLAYLIGLTYAAKQETLGRVENLWPLALLALPFLYAGAALGGQRVALGIAALFLAWVARAVWLLARRRGRDIPRAVVSLIAGISLLDAVLIAAAGAPGLAVLAVGGFLLTLAGQRWIAGT